MERFPDRTVPVEFTLDSVGSPLRADGRGVYARRAMALCIAERWIREGDGRPMGRYLSNLAVERLLPELVPSLPPFATPAAEGLQEVALFVGAPGSGTWRHYDRTDNVVVVISGQKRVRWAPPSAARPAFRFWQSAANFASGGPHDPFPGAREIVLDPGDALFVPARWWHDVENLCVTSSLSVVFRAPLSASMQWQSVRLSIASRIRSRYSPLLTPTAVPLRGPGARSMATPPSIGALPMLSIGDDTVLSLSEVLSTARVHQKLDFARSVARVHVIRSLAKEQGWTVSDESLQGASDALRAAHGLDTAAATHDWLAERGLSLDDYEAFLEDQLLEHRALLAISRTDVEAYFRAHQGDFGGLVLRSVTLPEEPLAHELRLLVEQDGEDFEALGRRYGSDPAQRLVGGAVRYITRGSAPGWLPEDAFSRPTGTLLGPLASPTGWILTRIESHTEPALDPAIDTHIRRILLDALIAREDFAWVDELAQATGL